MRSYYALVLFILVCVSYWGKEMKCAGELPPVYAYQDFNYNGRPWQSAICNPITASLGVVSEVFNLEEGDDSRPTLDPAFGKQGGSLRWRNGAYISGIKASTLPPAPSLITQEFTISFWIYASSNSSVQNNYSGYLLFASQTSGSVKVAIKALTTYLGNACDEDVSAVEDARGCLYLSFGLYIKPNIFTLNTSTNIMDADEWTHVVFSYSARGPSIWVNSILQATARNDSSTLTINTIRTPSSNTTFPLFSFPAAAQNFFLFQDAAQGLGELPTFKNLSIDELRFYQNELDEAQIATLYEEEIEPVGSISVQIIYPSQNSNISVVNATEFVGNVSTPTGEANLLPYWSLLSTDAKKCGNLQYSNQSGFNTSIDWGRTLGNYTFDFCVTNGVALGRSNITVNVTGQAPLIQVQPNNVTLSLGNVLQINDLLASSFPPPIYLWQRGVVFNRIAQIFKRQLSSNITNVNNNETIIDNSTAIAWTDTNQTTAIYYGGVVNEADNGTYYRVRVTSDQDPIGVYSNPVRVEVLPILFTESSTDNRTGKIVGGVLGGILGLFCCCLICLLIVLFILFRAGILRKRRSAKKLVPPDYKVLTYGNYNDPLFSKKTREEGLVTFESLLLQERGNTRKYVIPVAIAESEEVNQETLKALVWLFQTQNRGLSLLEELIEREVKSSTNESILFRANSSACQFHTIWVRTLGIPYIWNTLVVPVNDLNDNAVRRDKKQGREEGGYRLRGDTLLGNGADSYGYSNGGSSSMPNNSSIEGSSSVSGTRISKRSSLSVDGSVGQVLTMDSMEVDPAKLEENIDESDRTVNTLQLWLVAQKLFNSILKSERTIPEDVRSVLKHVKIIVEQKYDGEAAFKAMGAFMFLRYICPSLLAPHQWGLLHQLPHPVAQRQLILLGKVIQNLANGTLPGAKEDYMEKLNEFIVTNQQPLVEWYEAVVNGVGPRLDVIVPDQVRVNSVLVLYGYVWENQKSLKKYLIKTGESEVAEALEEVIESVGEPDWQRIQQAK